MAQNKFETKDRLKLCIIMPIFNDFEIAELLIKQLDDLLDVQTIITTIILIDDGSTKPIKKEFLNNSLKCISTVDIVHLHRNLGHQRAIAVGLTHIYKNHHCNAVLVMDADGEDKPEDVLRLIQEFRDTGGHKIIFAERTKRLDNFTFKVFYKIYRILHLTLTGIPVKVGNFSIIPFNRLSALVLVSELWNHYAAAVFSSRTPYKTIPSHRGNRLGGESTMNFTALVLHGLSAISVFTHIVGVRLLLVSFIFCTLLIALLIIIILVHLTKILIIPSWVSYSAIFLVILLLQTSVGCFSLVFFALTNRNNLNFIPIRDCEYFKGMIKRVYPKIE